MAGQMSGKYIIVMTNCTDPAFLYQGQGFGFTGEASASCGWLYIIEHRFL
jgi:hypothetical protein